MRYVNIVGKSHVSVLRSACRVGPCVGCTPVDQDVAFNVIHEYGDIIGMQNSVIRRERKYERL